GRRDPDRGRQPEHAQPRLALQSVRSGGGTGLARMTADRDSLSAVLRRLEETPDYYLGRARAARADGALEEALRLVEQLVVRFPDSDQARAARRLKTEIRTHVGDSLRAVAERGLEGGDLPAARRALEQLQTDWSDTPAARRLPTSDGSTGTQRESRGAEA